MRREGLQSLICKAEFSVRKVAQYEAHPKIFALEKEKKHETYLHERREWCLFCNDYVGMFLKKETLWRWHKSFFKAWLTKETLQGSPENVKY